MRTCQRYHSLFCEYNLSAGRSQTLSVDSFDLPYKVRYRLHRRIRRQKIGRFEKLFPVLMTDNGAEFPTPLAFEFDTRLFCCDLGVPNPKPGVEGTLKHLRRMLVKGAAFYHLTQEELNGLSPSSSGMMCYPFCSIVVN